MSIYFMAFVGVDESKIDISRFFWQGFFCLCWLESLFLK